MMKAGKIDLSDISNELSFLLFILREDWEWDEHRMREYASKTKWDSFLQFTLHHRVYPIVYLKLSQIRSSCIPADVMETLRYHYNANILKMMQLTREMNTICGKLESSGIRSLILKGPVLAVQLYGDMAHRTSKDLDILLDIEDVESAEEVMAQLGYEAEEKPTAKSNWKTKTHHLSFRHKEHAVQVEVHWRLNPYSSGTHSFHQLWERKNTVEVMNLSFYCLGNEDLLYYLADHGARHAWFRLRWLVDIDRLIPQLNSDEMLVYFREHGGQSLAGQAFLLSEQLFDSKIPSSMGQLTNNKKTIRLARTSLFFMKRIVKLNPVPEKSVVWPYFRYSLSLMTGRQRARYLLNYLEPNGKDMSQLPLYKPLHFLYFPLRPFLWFWRHIINN
ncbi:nucleotidyltransferase family protein [Paenibacillus sp. LHD-117]|uniref:nucleotidyltransferase domain-containing protein n=1 Tax=Paenibacillus sp. LHD-117 TaxID=3071412 RepID=UPI0027E0F610|nr:nucleotidyltransferase family protein [Paenibacillus sp. LHD-117]MDQ6421401.1 nucleotidyltransferase family protein [Paenibacillus sp. LHD-117]